MHVLISVLAQHCFLNCLLMDGDFLHCFLCVAKAIFDHISRVLFIMLVGMIMRERQVFQTCCVHMVCSMEYQACCSFAMQRTSHDVLAPAICSCLLTINVSKPKFV